MDDLIRDLALLEPGSHACNQYAFAGPTADREGNRQRRANLHRYLLAMASKQPGVLVVAEAAGYRGCRLTGIPFLSPALLAAGVVDSEGSPLLAESAGYTLPWTGRPVGEQSATIVWDTLRAADRLPLLWNVYPLHPHRPGEPQSNRRPTAAEVAIGLPFVLRLMELFAFERIAAVGRVAAEALRRACGDDRQIWALHHPAHGGAQPFATGMLAVLAGNDPAAGSTPP